MTHFQLGIFTFRPPVWLLLVSEPVRPAVQNSPELIRKADFKEAVTTRDTLKSITEPQTIPVERPFLLYLMRCISSPGTNMRIVREMPGDFLSLSGAEKRPSGHSPCPLGWARPGRSPKGPRHCGRQQGGRTGWLSLRREQLLLALAMVGNRPFWMLRGSEWKGTHDSCLRGLSVRVAVTPVPEAKLFPTSPQRARRLLLGDMWNVTILHVT